MNGYLEIAGIVWILLFTVSWPIALCSEDCDTEVKVLTYSVAILVGTGVLALVWPLSLGFAVFVLLFQLCTQLRA